MFNRPTGAERVLEKKQEKLPFTKPFIEKAVPVKDADRNNRFNRVIAEEILKAEGGYVNNPKDPGGETKYGISKRSYPDLDIKNITKEQALKIYYQDYYKGSGAITQPLGLDVYFFDTAVNSGAGRARALLKGAKLRLRERKMEETAVNLINEMHCGRIAFLAGLRTFNTFGRGWARRCEHMRSHSLKNRE